MREKQIVMDVRRGLRGAGGGGGKDGGDSGGRAPVEAPDSLRSIEYAKVLDLVSEGEIVGPVTGDAQSIYLDDTPLMNADGSYNFPGIAWGWVPGTQSQGYLPGFSDAEAETAVSTEVKNVASVTRQVTNVNVNSVRVTVAVPQLTSQDTTTGDLNGTSVQIAIDVQSNGGGFVAQVLPDNGSISGKTTTRYQRSYRISLAGLTAPWDIRVRRITADSGSGALVNKTFWDSYTEIIDSKLTYPNSGAVGLALDASRFGAIPKRSYDFKGIKVQIPSNYNPLTRVYTGVWDGTFATAWTDNPAWVFYDLLTNTRYGLGNYVAAAQVDKWGLYSIAQYCDQTVSNGFGGTEPRFTCNLYLQTRAEAYKVLANVASIFRGMAYWAAGAVTATADMPASATALFTAANVIDGRFSYAGSARNTRHTVALVTWNDPADAYKQKVEYVEDQTGINRYGVIETPVVAFGCTSRGQAHRLGRWLLYSERLETETVTFRVGMDGTYVQPGAVINTSDPPRAGLRMGGRVGSGATTGSVPIDNAVTISNAKTYTLSIIAPDGSVLTQPVTNSASTTSTLTVSPAFAQAPQTGAIWMLAASDLAPETWRVVAVTEADATTLEIVALKYDANKFAAVENNLIIEPAKVSTINAIPDSPTELQASESLFLAGPSVVNNRVLLSWRGTTGHYAVAYRGSVGNWVQIDDVMSQTIELDGLLPDTYSFNVWQTNSLGIRSPLPATLDKVVYGKTAPPQNVTGLNVVNSSGVALVSWTAAPDPDVSVGGTLVLRHSMATVAATWENSVVIGEFDGNTVSGLCPLVTGTYFAKWLDSTGNYSVTATSFVATEGLVSGFNTIASSDQAALPFTGAKSNVAYDATMAAIKLDSATLIDSMLSLIDTWQYIDSIGGVSGTGTYSFDTYIDLTTSAMRRFESDIQATTYDTGDLIDNWGLIDDRDSIDGTAVNDCNAILSIRLTDDNPSGSPTWGPWIPYRVGDFKCRAAQHKLDLVSGNATHNIAITALKVDVKTPVSP